VQQAGSEASVIAQIDELYGWTKRQFMDKALYSVVLERKIDEALHADPSHANAARERVDAIRQQIVEGADFSDMATVYSEDSGSAAFGGDLGFFGRGIMVPEFEAAAFSLPVGELSDVVETVFGYHIILVDEVTQEGGE